MIKYHVFANNYDDWFDDFKEAEQAYKQLGRNPKRLYEEIYSDEPEEENCIKSYGSYPM